MKIAIVIIIIIIIIKTAIRKPGRRGTRQYDHFFPYRFLADFCTSNIPFLAFSESNTVKRDSELSDTWLVS